MESRVRELLSQLGQEYDNQAAELRKLRLEVRRLGGVAQLNASWGSASCMVTFVASALVYNILQP